MAWCHIGTKPLPEPMITQATSACIYVSPGLNVVNFVKPLLNFPWNFYQTHHVFMIFDPLWAQLVTNNQAKLSIKCVHLITTIFFFLEKNSPELPLECDIMVTDAEDRWWWGWKMRSNSGNVQDRWCWGWNMRSNSGESSQLSLQSEKRWITFVQLINCLDTVTVCQPWAVVSSISTLIVNMVIYQSVSRHTLW